MQVNQNLETWKNEVEEIKNDVERKREKYLAKGEVFNEKEMIKESVAKKVALALEEEKKKETTAERKTPVRGDDIQVLERMINLAKMDGIVEAAKFVAKTKNPWLVDAFHDKIAEEVEKEIRG